MFGAGETGEVGERAGLGRWREVGVFGEVGLFGHDVSVRFGSSLFGLLFVWKGDEEGGKCW